MMDATFSSVIRLHEQGVSVKQTAMKLGISHGKVTKILVTAGYIVTDESQLQKQGLSLEEICVRLGKSESAVAARLPYDKGMYLAEYPSLNALRIRKSRIHKDHKTSSEQ